MKRRILAVAAAAATAVAVLPAAPAFASAAATASLTGTTAVYPGENTFKVTVTNNEALLVGKTINAIRVNFPVNEAGIRLGSGAGTAPGFSEATATNLGSTQFITYRGGSLAPGGKVDITFPSSVAAPLAKDLTGDFRVQVSSNNFETASPAVGSLLAKVQVLEILQEGLKPVSPSGVTDRSGTAGQAITYSSTVKNHARSVLEVSAGLTSNGTDTITAQTISVPANGGTASAEIPVKLSDTAGSRTFTGTATSSGASAPGKTDSFTVEAPAVLNPPSLDGTRVKSGPGSARDFVLSVPKVNPPAVTSLTGALTFAGNTCGLVDAPTYPRGNSTQSLTFRCTTVNGTDGLHTAAITYSVGADDNSAGPYGRTVPVGSITIDNLAPLLDMVVSLPKDADGDQQTAVKNADTVAVSGNITNAGDLVGSTVRVTLQPDVGSAVVINAPVSGSGEKRTFSGSAKPTWDAAATNFTARVEATDLAGNSGAFQAPGSTIIDNKVPTLLPTPTSRGTVVDATTIEVTYSDRTAVLGGCDERMWLVDGRPARVSAVKAGDGKDCKETGSKVRVLTLSSPLGVDETPTVTYDPAAKRTALGVRPVKDSAGNDGVRETIDTVTELVPQAPPIISLERRDSSATAPFEAAYFDEAEQRYFTNVGGADALRLTVGGIRQNYTVEVLRNGAVVAKRTFTAAPSPLGGSSYNGDVLVPMPTTDGAYTFGVRLVSSQANAGDATPFTVVLDRVLPGIGGATISASTVTSTFTEKVVLGSDFADNWFVSEEVQGEEGPTRRTVNVNSVTADGQTVRKLEVTLLDTSKFLGVDYFRQSGTRYEDRAGNTMSDTLSLAG